MVLFRSSFSPPTFIKSCENSAVDSNTFTCFFGYLLNIHFVVNIHGWVDCRVNFGEDSFFCGRNSSEPTNHDINYTNGCDQSHHSSQLQRDAIPCEN